MSGPSRKWRRRYGRRLRADYARKPPRAVREWAGTTGDDGTVHAHRRVFESLPHRPGLR